MLGRKRIPKSILIPNKKSLAVPMNINTNINTNNTRRRNKSSSTQILRLSCVKVSLLEILAGIKTTVGLPILLMKSISKTALTARGVGSSRTEEVCSITQKGNSAGSFTLKKQERITSLEMESW